MTDSTENDVQPSAESENLEVISDKDKFYIELRKFYDNRVDGTTKPEWTKERVNAVINSIEQFKTASVLKQPKTQQQYRNAKKYDVMSVGEEKLLILRRKDLNSPVVQVPSTDMYYDILLQAHISTGHGGRDKLIYNLKQQYVIPVPIMILFLNLCKICMNKKSCPKTGIVVRPIISQDFNKRGQVDLIDLQSTPSHNYKWILNYQDHLTKFCFLRPLTSKKATEVAMALLKIFLEVGAPMILQSDNGKEFTASIIKELITLWPACKIVNGRPRHPQSQDCLHLQLYREPLDARTAAQGIGARGSPATRSSAWATFSLQHFLGLESGFTLDREAHTLALICTDHVLVLAFDTRERLIAWQVKVGNQLGASQEFVVVVPAVPPAGKLPSQRPLPAGPARLHLRRQRFALTSGTPPAVLGLWELQHLRRYGVVQGRFAWEGGARCGAGQGAHAVAADGAHAILTAVDNALRSARPQGTPSRNSNGADRDKTRPSTRLSDINTVDRSFLDSSSGIYEENFFGDDGGVSPYWPDERREFEEPSGGPDATAKPPWSETGHVTLERCTGCLAELRRAPPPCDVPLSPPAFSPAWTMEGTPESCSDSSSSNTEYLTPRTIRKSTDATPERPPKAGHLEQPKPPFSLPPHCRCSKEYEQCSDSRVGPYENYDVPKASHIEQVITSDYYDTPKRIKRALTEDLFQVTSGSSPGSLVLKKNCGCILKLGSKKKPLVVECEENLQPAECPCMKVTNWANNLISLPYCKRDANSDKVSTEVLTRQKAEQMAIYATVDVSRKTNRQSSSISDKGSQENVIDTALTNYQNVEPQIKEGFEGSFVNYENLEFALSLESYENAKGLLEKAGVTKNELEALSAHLEKTANKTQHTTKVCLKCGHSQKHKHAGKTDEYLLMEPSKDVRKEQCPTIVPNPGYTPMCPNPKWSQSLKYPSQKLDRTEIEKSPSIPTFNADSDRSQSLDAPSTGIWQPMQQRSASVDSSNLLEDLKEFDSSIGSQATSSSLETLRNLTIEHRRLSSPCHNDTECYDCYGPSCSNRNRSSENSSKETPPFRNKITDSCEIKRCSSVPGKAGGNRDSSSSNDSGVSSCSMKHAGEIQEFEMPVTSGHSQYQAMIHRRTRGSLLGCGHTSLPRKSKSSDPLRDHSMQLFRGDRMPIKSSSAEAEVPVLPPKQFKAGGVVDAHSSCTSSGTSDMSDYFETLSITSSLSSTDTPTTNTRVSRPPTNTLRPRSGKEYHVTTGYSGAGYTTCTNYTNLP